MRAHWRFSNRSDGDFSTAAEPSLLAARASRIVESPWTFLDQVHGATVIEVTRPGACSGARADALVTFVPGAALAVRTADCAGVVLLGKDDDGETVGVGVAHAGWRGLLAGVLQNAVSSLRAGGARQVVWRLGPCISPAHYEFGEDALGPLVDRYGEGLVGSTTTGSVALDLRAGVAAAMKETGSITEPAEVRCTAADGQYFSWRARRDSGRQVTVAWMTAAGE